MITDLQELLKVLNQDPLPHEIKKNDDGSLYIPISIIDEKLDSIFGIWDWQFQSETFRKNSITGKGLLAVKFPFHTPEGDTFISVHKSGLASVDLTGNDKLDYPKLDSMCRLNAAKKLGRFFGRELNRNIDDAALPVTQLQNESYSNDTDESYNTTLRLVKEAVSKEEALSILKNSEWRYHKELKEIANSKP